MELSFSNILKKGVNSILLQGISMLITLVLNWYLAKKLGAADYGIFTYAFSWVYLFGILSMLGLDSVLQRELVKLNSKNANRLMAYARKTAFIFSILVTGIFAIVIYLLGTSIEDELSKAMLVAITCLPVFTQLLVNKNICLGLKKVELSILPENILRPLFALLGLLVISTFFFDLKLELVITINIAAIVLAFLFSFAFLKNKLNIDNEANPTTKSWLTLGFTFFLLTATTTINSRADILMLGFFGHTDKVGIYNIAAKLSTFIALPLFILNKVIAPYISQYFKTQQQELTQIVKKLIRVIFVLGLIGFCVFYFLGEFILNYFGEEFIVGYFVLLLLSGGQLINLFVGPVGNTLRMSEYEQLALKSMLISTIINIVLNLTLIPFYGMDGAAIATFTSLIFWNVYQFILVKKKLNMNLSVI